MSQKTKTMKLDSIFDIYGSPGYLLRRSGQFVTSTFEGLANDTKITTGQMTVLLAIYFEPGLQQLELAARLNWDEATMGGMIKRLESNGYIERRSSTRSSRGRQIYLTEDGLQLYKHLRPKILQTQRKLMKNLTPDESATLLYLLSKLLDIDTPHFNANNSKAKRSQIK
tara:strand:+ start:235 stop:741 length:507 start_codon:yes stop_codon:yes gene_type:complete